MPLPKPVTALNGLRAMKSRRSLPARLTLNDVTLREGEQGAGVQFSLSERLEIARMLESLGVGLIQVGYPGRFGRDFEAATRISLALSEAHTEAVALAFVDDWEAEIDACIASGVDVVHVVCRASERLRRLLRVSRQEVLHRAGEAVGRVVGRGCRAAFSPSDSTRTDVAFLRELWRIAEAAGAERVYVADSMGVATPELMRFLVQKARETVDVAVGVHCHNDFGLAAANTLAGVTAGAEYADVALAGLGDRAGNAALEEVVTALALLYEYDAGCDLGGLTSACRRVLEILNRAAQPNKAIIGEAVFTHVLPTHVRAMRADARAIQPFEAAIVGNAGRLAPRADEAGSGGEIKIWGDEVEPLASSAQEGCQ